MTNKSTKVDQEVQESNQNNTNTTGIQGSKTNTEIAEDSITMDGTDGNVINGNVTVIMNSSDIDTGESDIYS